MLWARGTLKRRVAAVRGIHAEIIRGAGETLRLWVEVAVSSGGKGTEQLALRGEALSWFAVANAREEQDILPSPVPINSRRRVSCL